MEHHFVHEALVGVVVMVLMGQQINCSSEGNKECTREKVEQVIKIVMKFMC